MLSEAEASIQIRPYEDKDYNQVAELIMQPLLYGGEYSDERDSKERLHNRIVEDPESIWVADREGLIEGTISLIIDARSAWLYRFIVDSANQEAAEGLLAAVLSVARKRGHKELLIYSDPNNQSLVNRYQKLGFNEGDTYICYWINT